MLERVQRRFDLVLVHGDPSLVAFDETFPQAPLIAGRLRYTGYVIDPPPPMTPDMPRGEVLVSAGGGAVGEPLLRAALGARVLSRARDLPWRLLVGHNLPFALFDELRAAAPAGTVVERARTDFPALLRGAALSISQGGYNTVMEVLDARCRAVIVPYAGGLESEQTLRATRLAARGLIQTVADDVLAPETLALAVDRALAGSPADSAGIDTGGGPATARILHEALARHGG
jgi:predicted glycosyltransferase